MRKTGIRNLKDHLSEYLQYVRNGETVVITHHKRDIAIVIPVEADNDQDKLMHSLQRLAEENLIILPEKPRKHRSRVGLSVDLLKVGGKPVSEIVLDDRR